MYQYSYVLPFIHLYSIKVLKLRNILSDLQSVFFEFTSQAPAIKTEAFCLDLTKTEIFFLTVHSCSPVKLLTKSVGIVALLVTWFSLQFHLNIHTSHIRPFTTSTLPLSRWGWRYTTVVVNHTGEKVLLPK